MIFDKVHILFWIRIRIHNLKLRIRILQKVSDPYESGFGSGSTTLIMAEASGYLIMITGTGMHVEFKKYSKVIL
jgi:hypothetical protein